MLERMYIDGGNTTKTKRNYYTYTPSVKKPDPNSREIFLNKTQRTAEKYSRLTKDLRRIERGVFDGVARIEPLDGTATRRRAGKPFHPAEPYTKQQLSPLTGFLDRPSVTNKAISKLASITNTESRKTGGLISPQQLSARSERSSDMLRSRSEPVLLKPNMRLPLISALSPRSKKRARQLPPASIEENKQLHQLEKELGFSLVDPRKLQAECENSSMEDIYSRLRLAKGPRKALLADSGTVVNIPYDSVMHTSLFEENTISSGTPASSTKGTPTKKDQGRPHLLDSSITEKSAKSVAPPKTNRVEDVTVVMNRAPAEVREHLVGQLTKLQWASGTELEDGYRRLMQVPASEIRQKHLQPRELGDVDTTQIVEANVISPNKHTKPSHAHLKSQLLVARTQDHLDESQRERSEHFHAMEASTRTQWGQHNHEVIGSAMGLHHDQDHSADVQAQQQEQLAVSLEAAREELPTSLLLNQKMDAFSQKQGLSTITRLFARLLHQVAAIALHRWVDHVEKCIQIDQRAAAAVITRIARGYVGRKEFRDKLEQREDQHKRQQIQLTRSKQYRRKYALVLQSTFRGLKGRHRFQRQWELREAAYAIQRRWRVHSSCITVAGKRGRKKRRMKAAIEIQRIWRGHRARRARKLYQKLEQVEKNKMKKQLVQRRAQEKLTKEGAALRIQQQYRARNRRYETRKLINLRKSEMATKMQNIFRVRLAQKVAAKKRRKKEKKEKKRIAAVVQIQRWQFCCLAMKKRKLLFMLKRETENRRVEARERRMNDKKFKLPVPTAIAAALVKDPAKAEEGLSINVDALRRRRNRFVHNMKPFQASRKEQGALKIQKVYRGYRTRKRIRYYRSHEFEAKRRAANRKRKSAATTIQAGWRGFKGREIYRFKIKSLAAICIQRHWRGVLGRAWALEYSNMILACGKIQARWRGKMHQARFRRMLSDRKLQDALLARVQAVARGRFCRQAYYKQLQYKRLVAEWKMVCGKRLKVCWAMMMRRMLLEQSHQCKSYHKMKKARKDAIQTPDLLTLFHGWSSKVSPEELQGASFNKLICGCKDLIGHNGLDSSSVDILFSKNKTKNTKHLTYPQFITALREVAVQRYPKIVEGVVWYPPLPESEPDATYGHYTGEDGAFLKLAIDSLYKHKGSKKSYKLLRRSVDSAMAFNATELQRRHRGLAGRRYFKKCATEKERLRILAIETEAAMVVQRAWRSKAAARAMIQTMKQVFRKYIDPETKAPYWYNPITEFVAWEKPRLFGSEDCNFEHIVPTEWTEYVVLCGNCEEKLATRLDSVVDEAYCDGCWDALHRRGHLKDVEPVPVFKCMDCSFQTATVREWTSAGRTDRCDTCYLSKMRDPAHGKHKNVRVVETCTECDQYSARWRCEVADGWFELYCNDCLSKVFNKGHKSAQRPTYLPYYTTTMHEKYEKQQRAKARKARAERIRLAKEAAYEKEKEKAALLVQAHFRGKVGRREGKWELKMGRMQQRRNFKQRKRDDKLRKGLMYRFEAALGVEPELKSDTLEERLTKGLSGKKKKRVLADLARNMSADQPTDPKKRRVGGFAVGTEEELMQQAKLGGVRLPGTVKVVGGENIVETTADLTADGPDGKPLLKRGSRLRIGEYIFFVDMNGEFTATGIKLDEKWVEEDAEALPIYRMDKLGKVSAMTTRFTRDFKGNREYQSYIKASAKIQGKLGKSIAGMAERAGGEDMAMGRRLARFGKKYQKKAMKNQNRIRTEFEPEKDEMNHEEREAEDTATMDEAQNKKKAKSQAAYMGTDPKAEKERKEKERKKQRERLAKLGIELPPEEEEAPADEVPADAAPADAEEAGTADPTPAENTEEEADPKGKKKKRKKSKKNSKK